MIQIVHSIISASSAKIEEAVRMAGPKIIDEGNPQDSNISGKI